MKSAIAYSVVACGLLLSGTAPGGHAQQATPAQGTKPSGNAPSDSSAKPKKRLDADLSGFDLSDDKSKKMSTMFGGSRGASFPSATLYAPKLAKFYGGAALFQWASEGKNDSYVLLITDEDETQIVKQSLTEAHYKLPAAQNKLQAGETYYWRVQVLPSATAGDSLGIKVVSASERQAVDRALAAAHGADAYQIDLARARVFTDHRLWFDAIGAYTELVEKYPDRAEAYEQRGKIYAQVDTTSKLADTDMARAADLTKSAH
jgi:Domain of Unknown Function (DUF928)